MSFMSESVYGGTPARQPTNNAIPNHAGAPEPVARTVGRPAGVGNPTVVLVALVGIAIAIVHYLDFSVSLEVSG